MPIGQANVAESLNNAIVTLAWLNGSNVLAKNLNDAWQAWFTTARNMLPDVAWWSTMKGFWAAYAGARASASNLNERTPPASEINPTLWKTLMNDVDTRGELLGDAGRATVTAIGNTLRPVLFVAGVLAVGFLFMGRRR
jgi:hypothetical protein